MTLYVHVQYVLLFASVQVIKALDCSPWGRWFQPHSEMEFFPCSHQEGLARGDTEAVGGPGFPLFQAFVTHHYDEPYQNLISKNKKNIHSNDTQPHTHSRAVLLHCVCPHLMSTAMRGTLRLSPCTILLCRIWNPLHSPNRFIMSSSQPYIHTEEVEDANNCMEFWGYTQSVLTKLYYTRWCMTL